MTTPQYRCFRTSITPPSNTYWTFWKDQDTCNGHFQGWLLGSRKCLSASNHEIWHMSSKQLICSISTMHVQSRCTSCISLNIKNFVIGSKLHTYQNIATKKAHAGVCYLRKESSIKIHIPCQVGDFRKYTGSLAFSTYQTTHRIHKCHFNYEYITVEYRQPSFVNFQCACKIIFDIIQVSCCLNMAQVKCPVSTTVDFSR